MAAKDDPNQLPRHPMLRWEHPLWKQFERDYARNSPTGWHANIETFIAMVDWVIEQGKWPLDEDPLADLEHDIQLARVLNARLPLPSGEDRDGAA